MSSILLEADALVSGDRQNDYGHPYDNWTQTAALWSPILGVEVTAEQALMCMIAVKIVRELHKPTRDNRVDMAGYANCLDMVAVKRNVRTPPPCTDYYDGLNDAD